MPIKDNTAHGNEGGARAVIHGTIMTLHPEPNQNMLLNISHGNLGKYTKKVYGIIKGNFQDTALSPI
jgi:hypothetical protein